MVSLFCYEFTTCAILFNLHAQELQKTCYWLKTRGGYIRPVTPESQQISKLNVKLAELHVFAE